MLLWYFFISVAVGFCCCFLSISNIIYTLLVMLRRGPAFAAVNVAGVCLAQAIWVTVTVIVLIIFGSFYNPARFDYWWDGLVVAAILFLLACRFLVTNPKKDLAGQPDGIQSKKQWLKQLSVGFALTMTTPQWAVAYLLILSSFNVALKHGEWLLGAAVAVGLLIGVIVFWLLALLVLRVVRARVSSGLALILNKIGAGVMILFGTAALVDSIWRFFAS